MKGDICKVIEDFFAIAKLPDELNMTYISLIPKKDTSEEVSQFHPVSCYNFENKIVSKVLANKMKVYLNDIILEKQSGFMNGRQV